MGHAMEDTSANPSKDARLRLRIMVSEGCIGGTSAKREVLSADGT